MFSLLLSSLLGLLFAYLAFNSLYLLFFAIAGRLIKLKSAAKTDQQGKFAVILCVYKGDEVILQTAAAALEQEYPAELYDVIVTADSLQAETIVALKKLPIIVLEVVFEESTKSKSLHKALEFLPDNTYDYAVVLDIDNIMEKDCLSKMNVLLNKGHKAVQAHRVAKNHNTSFAVLDAISEEINNHIFRKGHRSVGLSSALIGSGMAFHYADFKRWMTGIQAIGGFDKELEFTILSEKVCIAYVEDALVYDEKVMKAEVFGTQRRRWLSAQFVYLRRYFAEGFQQLFFRGNIDFFDKLVQTMLLPRVMLLGIVTVLTGINLLFPSYPGSLCWLTLLAGTVLALVIAVPTKYWSKATLRAALQVPKAFWIFFLILFKLKGANKKFIHTPHENLQTPH